MNKIPSKAGGLRRTQVACETVAIIHQHDVSHELQKSSPGHIKPEFVAIKDGDEAITCPPSKSSNFSDCPTGWPQPFECWTYATEVLTQEERNSLTAFIEQLVAHICNKTHTPTGNVDVGKVEARVSARTADELCFSFPQTFDKMHISIYKDLCRQFGSKYLLQAAMVLGDGAFEAAVAERLKAQLRAQKPDSLLKRRFFKRSTKVSPLCDIKSCHSDQNTQENSATLPTVTKSTGNAVWRRLSSMASTVKKTVSGNSTSES